MDLKRQLHSSRLYSAPKEGGRAAVMSPKLRVRREIQELVHMLATSELPVKPQHVPFPRDPRFLDLKKTKYLEEIQAIEL